MIGSSGMMMAGNYAGTGPDAYTKLLLHCDGVNGAITFPDSSQSAHAITRNGDTKVVGAPWANSGVGYFDGTGDYLSTPNSTDLDFGTGEFTIEAWVYFPNILHNVCAYSISTYAASNTLSFWTNTSLGNKGFFDTYASDGTRYYAYTDIIDAVTWHHTAIIRTGNALKFFLNGYEVVSNDITGKSFNCGGNVSIIGAGTISTYFNTCYIAEFRVSKGIARWTGDFSGSLPTADYSTDGYTMLLLHFTGTDNSTTFTDSSGTSKAITPSGDTKIINLAKFGTGAGYFDGTGDYLSALDSDDWNFGSGDFTIDFWIKFTDPSAVQIIFSQFINASNRFEIYVASGELNLSIQSGGALVELYPAMAAVANTWYHVAVVRNGSSFQLYKNGSALGSPATYAGSCPDLATSLYVGIRTGSTYPLGGYIDELRVSKGIARWTAPFVPPTAPY